MFKVGELVSAARSSSIGVVIDTKVRYGAQYCKVLWTGDSEAHWVSYENLRDRA
jgi:hypothetical protein